MKYTVFADYEALSQEAAKRFIALTDSFDQPLVCVASGDSPAGLYRNLVQQKESFSVANWHWVGLDEWQQMNASDAGSCQAHLNRQLFEPLEVEREKICFFDGKASSLEAECERVNQWVDSHGGIDVAIVGLGINGHIGMNEPGRDPSLRAHIAELEQESMQTAQKYFTEPTEILGGLSLGITDLLNAKHILLPVSGAHKAGGVKAFMESEPNAALPVSWLKNHPGLELFLDQAAASAWKTSGND